MCGNLNNINIYYYSTLKKKKKSPYRIKGKFNVLYIVKSVSFIGSVSTLLNQFNISSVQFLKEATERVSMFIDDIPINLKLIIYEGGKFDFNIYGLSLSFLLKSIYFFKHKNFFFEFLIKFDLDDENIDNKIFDNLFIKFVKKLKNTYYSKFRKNQRNYYFKTFSNKFIKIKTFLNIYDLYVSYKYLIDYNLDNNYIEFIYNKINFFKIMLNNIKRLGFIPDIRKSINILIYFLKYISNIKFKYQTLINNDFNFTQLNLYEE